MSSVVRGKGETCGHRGGGRGSGDSCGEKVFEVVAAWWGEEPRAGWGLVFFVSDSFGASEQAGELQ